MSHRLTRVASSTLLLALAVCFTGCSHFHSKLSAERMANGYTLILPGIEGASVFNSNLAQGLVNGGVPTAVEVDDWTTGFAPMALFHLRSTWRHRTEAERIAAKLVAYHDQYPESPIYLIGHSGGGAMAVYVMELLPEDVQVTRAILLSPALSPGYDLSLALDRTAGGIWNFYTQGDLIFTGLGTTVFGSVDGAWRPAAGMMGFRGFGGELIGDLEAGAYLPANGSARSLADHQWGPELRQVGYRPEMILTGNTGGHFGGTTRLFASQYLAPLINLESM